MIDFFRGAYSWYWGLPTWLQIGLAICGGILLLKLLIKVWKA